MDKNNSIVRSDTPSPNGLGPARQTAKLSDDESVVPRHVVLFRYIGVVSVTAILGLLLAISMIYLYQAGGADPVVTATQPADATGRAVSTLPKGVAFAPALAACVANNAHLDLDSLSDLTTPVTGRFYPAFSQYNNTPVAISYTVAITTPGSNPYFGPVPYSPGTPWDRGNPSALSFQASIPTVTLHIDFSSPVYGLKFTVSDLDGSGEQVEIRMYDVAGTLIPTSSIVNQTQSLFVTNQPTSTFSYGTLVNSLGEGPGGGYAYAAITTTNVTTDAVGIFVQMGSLVGVSRVEIDYTNQVTPQRGGIFVTTPYFNLPCLGKAFDPSAVQFTESSTLSLTILNSADNPQRSGIGFTDNLTDDLELAATPVTPQCNGVVTGSPAGKTLSVSNASFSLNQASCVITASVIATSTGAKLNSSAQITAVQNLYTDAISATLTVSPKFISGLPPTGTYGSPYTFTFAALAFPFVSYSISGTLPPGLSLISTTGILSGTPTQAGVFPNITAIASNNDGPDATQLFTITIDPAPLLIVAQPAAMYRNDPLPQFKAWIYGLVNNDPPSVLGTLAFTTTYHNGDPFGIYQIFVSGVTNSNYDPTYIPAKLYVYERREQPEYNKPYGPYDLRFKPYCPPWMMGQRQGGDPPKGVHRDDPPPFIYNSHGGMPQGEWHGEPQGGWRGGPPRGLPPGRFRGAGRP